ncbi:MAG: M3 family metallopeptidase, partial [Bacteroidota bacterium]|nr:M3 family metallopeptidase [Bacteroidota bacterium]
MKKLFIILMVTGVVAVSCKTNQKEMDAQNPFFQEWSTPFGTPPFDKIKPQHYQPAFSRAMGEQQKEIEKIANNPEAPTFENTIVAFDASGSLLNKVNGVFNNLLEANTSDTLQQIAEVITPDLSKHSDWILMNEKLFSRIKSVYNNQAKEKLNPEQKRLLEETYKLFVRSGANLNENEKNKLKMINKDIASLTLKFSNNVLAETNAYKLVIDKKQDLAGLPEAVITTAAEDAKQAGMPGKWVFTLQKPSMIPFLTYAENRALREKIYKAYLSRGNNNNSNDNKAIIAKIVLLRADRAKMLGYKNHAAYVLDNNMAKTPDKAFALLNQLWKAALPVAKKEVKEMQAIIDKEGKNFKLESWDWWYYAEKVKKAKYALDEEMIRPYFKLENVREGAFAVANKLYGYTFSERKDIPVYHPDVKVYEVKDSTGNQLGILYLDYFPRASKKGGAWMEEYRRQWKPEGKNVLPIVCNVGNFTKPAGNDPALLSWDDVLTLFHEFGHALHGLSSNNNYYSLSGTAVATDFVELPSQIMENWAAEPEVLKMFAKHYKTGEVIPDELIAKIKNSGHFN